jgi:short chain dehydrogenase
MSKLPGKVAVVPGASKGIGAAIAKSLAAEGASVVVNYASSKAGAETVVAAITAAGGKAVAVGGDVTKAAEAQGIIDAAVNNYGRLDILVNNSGVYEFAPIEAITEDHFHKMTKKRDQEKVPGTDITILYHRNIGSWNLFLAGVAVRVWLAQEDRGGHVGHEPAIDVVFVSGFVVSTLRTDNERDESLWAIKKRCIGSLHLCFLTFVFYR